MKRIVWRLQLCGFAVSSLLGTLLHFLYDWLGRSALVAPFSGTNESTFEHMKLLFWPMLLFAVIESFFFREYEGFWQIKARGGLVGLSLIPIIFYTYNGVIGKSPDFVNIAIFFVCAAFAYCYETKLLNKDSAYKQGGENRAKLLLVFVALAFVIFTFKTPRIALFMDPITRKYGI